MQIVSNVSADLGQRVVKVNYCCYMFYAGLMKEEKK